ncbi:MAG: hypothetical protein NTW86_09785 [Candidatus Sumerlaeota bacterium]|nr:hypothetical protein [Candidatus Sumerlaeota bacterium]
MEILVHLSEQESEFLAELADVSGASPEVAFANTLECLRARVEAWKVVFGTYPTLPEATTVGGGRGLLFGEGLYQHMLRECIVQYTTLRADSLARKRNAGLTLTDEEMRFMDKAENMGVKACQWSAFEKALEQERRAASN